MRPLLLALAVFAGTADSAPVSKTTAAVLDFEAVNTSAGDAAVVVSFVRSALVKTRLYSVVERRRMERVLSEQAFQQTGCTTSECAVKLGKLLNARKVIAGSLSVLGKERYLNIRLVDVETGEIENEETSVAFSNKEAPVVAEALVRRLLGLAEAKGSNSAAQAASQAGVPAEVTGQDGAAMVRIPAGEFTMGSNDYDGEKPPHRVTLSAFYLDKTEVTFDRYDAFCAATGRAKPDDNRWGRRTRPVIRVSWDDATAYAQHYGKRLPTEAE
ncbi:MAG: SUMF1/EgtB/PvdO family nonheme iron enzyme [bacterium]